MRVTSTTTAGPAVPTASAPPGAEVPLGLGEEQWVFLQGLAPGGRPLTVAGTVALTGTVDEARLSRAWAAAVGRLPTLRSALAAAAPGAEPGPPLLGLDRTAARDGVPTGESVGGDQAPLVRAVLLRDEATRSRLVVTGHRMVLDGPALGSLVAELGDQYARAVGPPPGSVPDGLDRPVLRSTTGRSVAWRAQAATEADALDLDPDQRTVAGCGWTGRVRRHRWPAPLGHRLSALAARLEARPRDVLTAALHTLLARHAGRDELRIAVPVPVAGDPRVAGGAAVPAYVALATRLTLRTSFADAVRGVRDAVLEAHARQDPRLAALLADNAFAAPGAHRPLLHAVVTEEPPAEGIAAWGPLTATWVEQPPPVTPFPLSLGVRPDAATFRTTLTFRADRFSVPFVHRFVERWSVLLAAALAEPGTALGRLPMLPADERSTLVQGWSRTRVSVPEVDVVHASVEAWARRAPDGLALVQGEESLTFATLNGRANGLARRLREAGVGRDIPVAVYDDPSIAAVVGLLAVLKAGGCYVPLDVSYPERRLRDIIASVRPVVFLTRPALRARLDRLRGSGPGRVLLPDPDTDAPTTPDLDIPVDPADLGYVLHTSGSTGEPKGIAMPHESLRRTIAWYPAETGIVAGSRLLQFSPFGFDSHFCEIFGTWHAGATVVLPADDDERRDPEALLRLLAAADIDHLEAPNSGLANLAHWVVSEGSGGGLRLRTIVTGGEQLLVTPDLVRWLSQLPGCAVRHGYGPTETGPTTSHWLRGRPDTWPGVPPIGRPVTDARVYVLDDALQPVPAGVAGEMYVGGPVLARGYLGAPGRTAERFIADPLGATAGERLYRTGDLARWTVQGTLEFLGRNDGQVKVRGFRIELAEVEAALAAHPGVTAAAAAVAPGGESLIGYVVPRGTAPDALALQQHLRQRLPAVMVPATFLTVSALPTTPSGKLDRSRLVRGR